LRTNQQTIENGKSMGPIANTNTIYWSQNQYWMSNRANMLRLSIQLQYLIPSLWRLDET